MSDYKAMYYLLFNAITDASRILLLAQREAEEMFVDLCTDGDADNESKADNAGCVDKTKFDFITTDGIK